MTGSSLVARAPHLSLALASGLACFVRVRGEERRAAADVATRCGLAPSATPRLARSFARTRLRQGVVRSLVARRGIEGLAPLVDVRGARHLERTAPDRPGPLVALWHLGVPLAVSTAFVLLELPVVMAVRRRRRTARTDILERIEVGGAADRAVFARRALERLRGGGAVAIHVDGRQGGRRVDGTFLGRPITLGRGLGALALRTGAPVVPVVARWIGAAGRIEVTFHAPLPRPDDADEEAVVLAVAAWFEERARAEPDLLRSRRWDRGDSPEDSA